MIGGPSSQPLTTYSTLISVVRIITLTAAMNGALFHGPGFMIKVPLLLIASVAILSAPAFLSLSASSNNSQETPKQMPQQTADNLKSALPLLLPIVAADTALIVGVAFQHIQLMAIAAGAVVAVALATITLQKRYIDRIHAWRAAIGDRGYVHINVKAESGATVDSSTTKRPIEIVVGKMKNEEEEAPSTSSAAGAFSFQGAQGTERFSTPAFAALLDELTPGMIVGEKVSITVHNPHPRDGGFSNPDLVWWQAHDDMMSKYRGKIPATGQVFWYPLGPGTNENWAPVRVNALNKDFVELDGNESIQDAVMVVEVELVSLNKV